MKGEVTYENLVTSPVNRDKIQKGVMCRRKAFEYFLVAFIQT